jgi:hypothetical protein
MSTPRAPGDNITDAARKEGQTPLRAGFDQREPCVFVEQLHA